MQLHIRTLRNYTLVGLLATATHYALLYTLVDLLHILSPVPASLLGFLAGASVGFVLNSSMVFQQDNLRIRALSKYILLLLFNSGVNTILMSLLVNALQIQYLLAQCSITLLIYVSNFIICKNWVFNEQRYAKQP